MNVQSNYFLKRQKYPKSIFGQFLEEVEKATGYILFCLISISKILGLIVFHLQSFSLDETDNKSTNKSEITVILTTKEKI